MVVQKRDPSSMPAAGLATMVASRHIAVQGRRLFGGHTLGASHFDGSTARLQSLNSLETDRSGHRSAKGGVLKYSNSSNAMHMCLEPDIYADYSLPQPFSAKGSGKTAFQGEVRNHNILHHDGGGAPAATCRSATRPCVRLQPSAAADTHYRIFETEPPAGKVRVRGDVAMELFRRNCSASHEKEVRHCRKHRHPADHDYIINQWYPAETWRTSNRNLTAFLCPENVNRKTTDFLTWRGPRSRAEASEKYTIKHVAHSTGVQGLLTWTTQDNAASTYLNEHRSRLELSSGLPKRSFRIASARKLADFTGNSIFTPGADAQVQPNLFRNKT